MSVEKLGQEVPPFFEISSRKKAPQKRGKEGGVSGFDARLVRCATILHNIFFFSIK
ncbi:hypothetical protein [Rhizobium vallis]|uniref:hypothetical protein n=1 Tax=Rhizobium vallis TaxID=634290 RepID=UPI0013DF5BEF|nr:hypothetical protein [Rhizobium vallis]